MQIGTTHDLFFIRHARAAFSSHVCRKHFLFCVLPPFYHNDKAILKYIRAALRFANLGINVCQRVMFPRNSFECRLLNRRNIHILLSLWSLTNRCKHLPDPGFTLFSAAGPDLFPFSHPRSSWMSDRPTYAKRKGYVEATEPMKGLFSSGSLSSVVQCRTRRMVPEADTEFPQKPMARAYLSFITNLSKLSLTSIKLVLLIILLLSAGEQVERQIHIKGTRLNTLALHGIKT